MEFQLPDISFRLMAPELFLFCWALVVIAFDVITKRRSGAAVGSSGDRASSWAAADVVMLLLRSSGSAPPQRPEAGRLRTRGPCL